MPMDDPARVAERLGPELYALRRQEEDDRIAEFCQYVSPKFTFIKIHFIRPAEVFVLKAVGLYRKGRREFHQIDVVENDIAIRDLPPALEGFTLLQMSDLHIDIDPALVETISAALAPLRYDVCVLTGDYKNLTVGDSAEAIALVARLRPAIAAPVYAVLGNHEYISNDKAAEKFLTDAGITLLRDSVITFEGITVIGRDDRSNRSRKPLADLAGDAQGFTILLDHQPYHLEEAELCGIDFQFSGHTHRGQIWPISWVTDGMYEKSWGHHRRSDTRYYVSSGLGIWGPKIRVGTRSEYLVLNIER